MLAAQAYAAQKPKVVMVVVPAVSLGDMTSSDLPGFRWLMERDCIGLMNSRTAGRINLGTEDYTGGKYTPEAGYVTIGAGARTMAGSDAAQAYNASEIFQGASAREVYRRMTLTDPSRSEVVHPKIARLTRDNSTLSYKVTIGALGAAIHKAGLKTAVIGNSDDTTPHREAVTIAMDSEGLVDYGDVGREMVIRDPATPSGYRTDEKALLAEFQRCLPLADFIVVELGDTARLDRASLDMMGGVYQKQRTEALKRTDRMLATILDMSRTYDAKVVLLSPYPSSYELEKHDNSLCPLIADVGSHGGLLSSGSARVAGVVTNTDVAPSVLAWMGVTGTHGLVGRPISRFCRSGKPAKELLALTTRVAEQNATNGVLRQAMVVVIVLIGIAMLLWFTLPAGKLRRRLVLPFLLAPPALAPAMLVLSLYATGSQLLTWLGLIAVTVGIVGLCTLIGRKAINALMLMGLGTAGLIGVDTILGNPLGRFSVMGYSIAEGARYYGLGNEFMGTLIGSAMVGLGLAMRNSSVRRVQTLLVVGLVVGTAVVGAPELGANMGGAIAVVIGFGCALLATSRKPFDVRRIGGIALAMVLAFGAFALLDSMRGAQYQSHLGRALQGIRESGFSEAGSIITRKLAMNWMLIRFGVWSRLLGACVASVVGVLIAGRTYSRLIPLPLHLRVALTGATAGTLAALAFNDSGVVAAATCFIYAWSLLVITVLDGEMERDRH